MCIRDRNNLTSFPCKIFKSYIWIISNLKIFNSSQNTLVSPFHGSLASVGRDWTGNLAIPNWCYYPLYHCTSYIYVGNFNLLLLLLNSLTWLPDPKFPCKLLIELTQKRTKIQSSKEIIQIKINVSFSGKNIPKISD